MARYFQIGINKTQTRRAFNDYITERWNSRFFDEKGKFIQGGSEMIRETHKATWDALMVKFMGELQRLNRKNRNSTEGTTPHNINKPTFTYRPFEIMRIMSQGLYKSLSVPTVKRYIKRIEKSGALKILSQNGQSYFIEINSNIIYLYDEITGKQLTNSKFLTASKSVNKTKKRTNTKVNTDPKETILRNKEIENDKSNLIKGSNLSQQQEHLKNAVELNDDPQSFDILEKQVQTREKNHANNPSTNPEMQKHEADSPNIVASQRTNGMIMSQKILYEAKKKAVITFWFAFIKTFWSDKQELYMPETAPSAYFNFIDTAQEVLMNDELYFGACNTPRRVNIQLKKLEAARKSTKHWYNARKKQDPKFNFNRVYPNTFLGKDLDEKLSFKKSVIYIEHSLERKNLVDKETENYLIEKRQKTLSEKKQHEINSLIFNIYSEKSAEKQRCMYDDTKEYISAYRADLWDGLRYALRADRVQEFLLTNLNYEIDLAIVTSCILNKQIIREGIEKLIPSLKTRIAKRHVDLTSSHFQQYFNAIVSPNNVQIEPRTYNQKTLDKIKYFITQNHR